MHLTRSRELFLTLGKVLRVMVQDLICITLTYEWFELDGAP